VMDKRAIAATLVSFVVLSATLVLELAWFFLIDPYNRHYFDAGIVVVLHNLCRFTFVLLLAWLIYAPGAGAVALIIPLFERKKISGTEQALLGVGFGSCIWLISMLLMGLAGLYYRWIMAAVALAVIVASSRHAGQLAWTAFSQLPRLRHIRARSFVTALIAMVAGFWLLTVKGLYPGGGGDYYTHYFPYALEVLKNHSLAMNEVWYHYWYSKGDGLFFLAMLLTDPMSQALVTSCFVAFAAIAIADLSNRLMPASLWPFCAALLYLLYNAVNMNQGGGGEFQKSHELVGALMTLMAWALCRHRTTGEVAFLAMAAACVSSVCIVNLPIGAVAGLFFGVLACEALIARNWRQVWHFCLAGAFAAGTAISILALNQSMTGLASDQGLALTMRFANFQRLDQLGLLPQIVALAWLRDNLDDLITPFGWNDVFRLVDFMRLQVLWPLLTATAIAVYCVVSLANSGYREWLRALQRRILQREWTVSDAESTTVLLGLLIGMLAVVVCFGGRAQSVSTGRLTTFFAPLLILFNVAVVACIPNEPQDSRTWPLLRSALPICALLASLISWQVGYSWMQQVSEGTINGLSFLSGRYSLASAFSRKPLGFLSSGFDFGGIEPGTLTASRQLPPDTPIWSTNVDSYCMVPHCVVESSISYRMSPRMDEVLGGSPELARQLLQEAGLNYFLFSKEHRLLDPLPFSRLFAPEVIGRYLGIYWTDGTTFLLTWSGNNTRPIDDDFLSAYSFRLSERESPWFFFRKLVPFMQPSVAALRGTKPDPVNAFVWRAPPAEGLDIATATYGENCKSYRPPPPATNMFYSNNAGKFLRDTCRGQLRCSVKLDVNVIGDPAQGCGKDFVTTYRCNGGGPLMRATVPAEAHGRTLVLECPRP
jgi:hypothetical protein